MALSDRLTCVICLADGYMSEPTHVDPDGVFVFCCYSCRKNRRSTIQHRRYVTVDDWIASLPKAPSIPPGYDRDSWDEITPVGGIIIDPKFKP